jgi:hypothetical protein
MTRPDTHAQRDSTDFRGRGPIHGNFLPMGELHPDWQRVTWKETAVELALSTVWQKAQPDAVWTSNQIIVAECYARVGQLKPGHRRKLAMDAFKLLALRHCLPHGQHFRSILVVPNELTARLEGDGWFPVALRLAAEVIPVALLPDERTKLDDALVLQSRGQSRTRRAWKDPAG